MTKLILHPSLFEIPDNMSEEKQLEHFMFLSESIGFVADFFQVSLDEYDGAPYVYNSEYNQYTPPITKSLIARNRYSEIRKKIQKMISKGNWIELQDRSVEGEPLKFIDNSVAEVPFRKYLYCILYADYNEDILLLLAQDNEYIPSVSFYLEECTYTISTIYDPAINCNNIVPKYLRPSLEPDNMFPQSDACFKLNDKFKEIINLGRKTPQERAAIYIKFGTEVACRNNYLAKTDISRKNPSYEVFVHNLGNFYLSIDKEHGGLEVFRNQGKHPLHLGEYDFSCNKNKDAEPETHKLIV